MNQINNIAGIVKDTICKEETIPMELVLFANITEREISNTPLRRLSEPLDLIAFENNLKCRFTPLGIWGTSVEIEKAQEILIKSVKYN